MNKYEKSRASRVYTLRRVTLRVLRAGTTTTTTMVTGVARTGTTVPKIALALVRVGKTLEATKGIRAPRGATAITQVPDNIALMDELIRPLQVLLAPSDPRSEWLDLVMHLFPWFTRFLRIARSASSC